MTRKPLPEGLNMMFTKLVAIVAISGLAVTANAGDGTLRRNVQVAQNDEATVETVTKTKEDINININTAPAPQPKAVAQPATVVEAQPVSASRADQLRKE